MPDFSLNRSILFAAAIAAVGLGVFGSTQISFGNAIVGETRKVDQQKGPSGVDALKAQYRRPGTIPFPKDNSFHAREGDARQETVFRYAAVRYIGAVMRELPQSEFRLG